MTSPCSQASRPCPWICGLICPLLQLFDVSPLSTKFLVEQLENSSRLPCSVASAGPEKQRPATRFQSLSIGSRLPAFNEPADERRVHFHHPENAPALSALTTLANAPRCSAYTSLQLPAPAANFCRSCPSSSPRAVLGSRVTPACRSPFAPALRTLPGTVSREAAACEDLYRHYRTHTADIGQDLTFFFGRAHDERAEEEQVEDGS